MPPEKRALLIAMIGPAIQAVGFAWAGVHILLSHHDIPLSARHIVFEPSVLLIFVGLLVSALCIPVALDVAQASEAELEIPVFGAETAEASRTIEGANRTPQGL